MRLTKEQIRKLIQIFPKDHKIFRIIRGTSEEISFDFIGNSGKKHHISVNIPDNYPSEPSLWFSESEEDKITNALETVGESGVENIFKEIVILVEKLCGGDDKLQEEEIILLRQLSQEAQSLARLDTEEEDEDSEGGSSDAIEFEEDKVETDAKKKEEYSGAQLALLERQKAKQSSGKGGSFLASDRLMKEMKNIYASESYKNGLYDIELIKDNLYEWKIKLMSNSLDADSMLHADLKKRGPNKDHVEIECSFDSSYPFKPPFVRVLSPIISGGHVTIGGAVCMELLTNQGWSSAYTVEALIMQIAATFVDGGGRVGPGPAEMQYTLANAKSSYDRMIRTHAATGWTPSKN